VSASSASSISASAIVVAVALSAVSLATPALGSVNCPSGEPLTKPSGGVYPPVGTVTVSPVVGF